MYAEILFSTWNLHFILDVVIIHLLFALPRMVYRPRFITFMMSSAYSLYVPFERSTPIAVYELEVTLVAKGDTHYIILLGAMGF